RYRVQGEPKEPGGGRAGGANRRPRPAEHRIRVPETGAPRARAGWPAIPSRGGGGVHQKPETPEGSAIGSGTARCAAGKGPDRTGGGEEPGTSWDGATSVTKGPYHETCLTAALRIFRIRAVFPSRRPAAPGARWGIGAPVWGMDARRGAEAAGVTIGGSRA